MEKGCIIIYKENKQYHAAEFVEEKNGRFRILTENNKLFYITEDKILKSTKEKQNLGLFIKKAIDYKLNIKELWDAVSELSDKFTISELTELFIGTDVNDNDFFSIIYKLQNDDIYFSIKDDFIYPNSNELILEKIAIIEKNEAEKQLKEQNRLNAYKLIVDILKSDDITKNTPIEVIQLLTPLKEYCVRLDEYSKKDEAISLYHELIELSGLKPDKNIQHGIFDILIKSGILTNIDEILPLRHSIKTSFSDNFDSTEINDQKRTDLRNHASFTIDSEETKDIDDGLSIVINDDSYDFYIHIADPDSVITKDSLLDKEAFSKGTSVYLVTKRHPMFPETYSYNNLSLIAGEDRPAISLKITTDHNYKIISSDFMLSKVNIKSRLSYNQVDKLFDDNAGDNTNDLKYFLEFANKCRQKREESNALMLDHHDLSFTVDDEGKVKYQIEKPGTKSQTIVQEMMILFNKTVAEYCILNNLDSIFITQESPNDEIKGKRSNFARSELQAIFPRLKKSVIGTTAGPHYCMGLSYYTQATSPIRRYLDLTVHRILKSSILGNANPFNEDDLRKIVATVSAKSLNSSAAERESIKYWSLKFIEQNIENKFKALVIRKVPGGILCELDELLLKFTANGTDPVEIGDYVTVDFKNVFPFTGDIKAGYKKGSE